MAKLTMPRRISIRQTSSELGFGKTITTSGRMMNPDGTFNVLREPTSMYDNMYHSLITMKWWYFLALLLAIYLLINCLFAGIYVAVGVEHLAGTQASGIMSAFLEAYFFSTQTLTTVGYGRVSPMGLPANLVASIESFTGLLLFALVSGLMYGRFSRPTARIVFSEHLLVAPFREGRAFMFRMGNARRSELIETEVQVILAINQNDDHGGVFRRFFTLELEIKKVSFFSLSWTIVHPIDEKSPLFGFTAEDLADSVAEFLVLVKSIDETNQQMVHARRSYSHEEVVWNARFLPVIGRTRTGTPYVMTRQMGQFEPIGVPENEPI